MTPAAGHAWARWRLAGLAWALGALFVLGLAAIAWLDHLSRQAGRPDLAMFNADAAYAVVGVISATAVGVVVASRRPAHPVGWLLLAFGLLMVISAAADGYVGYGLVARPGALPAAEAAVVVAHALGNSGAPVLVLALAVLLTPTGSPPSPRWRWVATALAAVAAGHATAAAFERRPLAPPRQSLTNPLAIDTLTGPPFVRLYELAAGAIGLAFVLAILAGAGSLLVRFRRARGIERQQLRWLALAAAMVPVAALVTVAGALIDHPAATAAARFAPGAATWLVPLALGAAVLRYRLYDLDRILSRTLAYGLLTLLLGGGYALVVLGLGQLLGRDSPLVVAGATLAVAGLFQPARRRIQRAVDRRFNRRRHDAAQLIAAFSARLRDELDLDTLSAELLAVVEQTMQPTQAWLWLRPSPAATSATGGHPAHQ